LNNTLNLPWFQRFIFIIFIAKGGGKINLWNQGTLNLAPGIFFNYPTYPQLSNISGWRAKRLYPAHKDSTLQREQKDSTLQRT
jgi:hypothetical protein